MGSRASYLPTTMMGSDDLVIGEDHMWDRVASGITGKRAGEAR